MGTGATDILQDVLSRASKAGATAADAFWQQEQACHAEFRRTPPADLTAAAEQSLALRVFVGARVASVDSTDLAPAALQALAERAVHMARLAPEDPYAGIAAAAQYAAAPPAPVTQSALPPAAHLAAQAQAAAEAALAVPGITNLDEAQAGCTRRDTVLATSAGFLGRHTQLQASLSVVALAGEGTARQRDYEFVVTPDLSATLDPAAIGRTAAERARARLNPIRLPTGPRPVVFAPRAARSVLSHFLSGINGASIARGTSFLREALGQQIFPAEMEIREDPHRPFGHRTRFFDGEGLPTQTRALVKGGVVQGWLLDLAAARQLQLPPTGHAGRHGAGISPQASNVCIAAGNVTPSALMADIKDGFYVTELMGQGVNMVTGDYSRGATGFEIVNGDIGRPVAEVTIAGNLIPMFARLQAADDLRFETGLDAPTLRIDGMMLAGA